MGAVARRGEADQRVRTRRFEMRQNAPLTNHAHESIQAAIAKRLVAPGIYGANASVARTMRSETTALTLVEPARLVCRLTSGRFSWPSDLR